ncbi:lytic polysaccharide monooxygenase auxiliary activity family 9 protein [Actinoplanes friuliensis]|jgi:predicted carbohydrate-binding protein with CBM5 and CBM33 domain|uniref:Putative chitin-binding protein n=1 Tax=Actinoplanes friuliensis DSM 7358 TaxID=1246995 RepID=U5W5X0_9ACTN|nr:lytic polysaccharide monooxygenase [Actinoplanes friuliensis]AGZ43341.1 putative chitin-binding protein [Actinoplanes friuliensis DSM 7358]
MTVVRRTAALVMAGGFAAAATLLPAAPSLAHGAPTSPISRTAACATNGEQSGSAACKAALQANGRGFGNFDNLRVPNVNGKDKQFIPDGNLCSGDLPEFQGLDLPRTDWPTTKVNAGANLPIRYAGTIPHQGTFRIYLTKQGYDPTEPLGWDDLGASPISTVQDPPLRSGAYRMSAKLPKDRSGRHVLYVVWQTSSTPDTYYSCSDLQIKAKPVAVAATKQAKPAATPKESRSVEPGVVASPQEVAGPAAAGVPEQGKESWLSPAAAQAEDRVALGHQIIVAALIVIAGVGAAAGFNRWRGARNGGPGHQAPRR